ncbi:hypothetical protein M0812_09107 [Anaeramoeba flamelloides]|uniref:WD40 repeat-like protein n=1 Tax=Anaeramoeba flamelloides TaxID=1746091 RepID=A0AAV7ZMN3_9EUKA|nr:hypothetical protein M0812_09107 [Anaeramoeba flamelloides]
MDFEYKISLIQQFLSESGFNQTLSMLKKESKQDYDPNNLTRSSELSFLLDESCELKKIMNSLNTEKEEDEEDKIKRSFNEKFEFNNLLEKKYPKKVSKTFSSIHPTNILTVSISPNKKFIATGSTDKTLKITSLENGEIVHTFSNVFDSSILTCCYDKTGDFLVCSTMGGLLYILNLRTKKLIQKFKKHSKYVISVDWSKDGNWIASASYDNSLCLYQLSKCKKKIAKKGKENKKQENKKQENKKQEIKKEKGKVLEKTVKGGEEKEKEKGKEKENVNENEKEIEIEIEIEQEGEENNQIKKINDESSNSKMKTIQQKKKTINENETSKKIKEKELKNNNNNPYQFKFGLKKKISFRNPIQDVIFGDNSREMIVAVRNENNLYYINCETLKVDKINLNENLDNHVSFSAMHLSLSPDEKYLLVTTDKDRIITYLYKSSIQLRNFYGTMSDKFAQYHTLWSPNNYFVFSTSQIDKTICVWNIHDEKLICRLEGHTKLIRDIDIAQRKDGSYFLVSCGYDKKIIIWEL